MQLTRRDFFAALVGSGLAALGTWSGSTWLVSAAPPEVRVPDIEMGRITLFGAKTDFFGMRIPLTSPGTVSKVVLRYQGREDILVGAPDGIGNDWVFYSPLPHWMDGQGIPPAHASFVPLREEELRQFESVEIHVQDPGNPGEGPVVWEWKRTP